MRSNSTVSTQKICVDVFRHAKESVNPNQHISQCTCDEECQHIFQIDNTSPWTCEAGQTLFDSDLLEVLARCEANVSITYKLHDSVTNSEPSSEPVDLPIHDCITEPQYIGLSYIAKGNESGNGIGDTDSDKYEEIFLQLDISRLNCTKVKTDQQQVV
jgi:hypothetical protein